MWSPACSPRLGDGKTLRPRRGATTRGRVTVSGSRRRASQALCGNRIRRGSPPWAIVRRPVSPHSGSAPPSHSSRRAEAHSAPLRSRSRLRFRCGVRVRRDRADGARVVVAPRVRRPATPKRMPAVSCAPPPYADSASAPPRRVRQEARNVTLSTYRWEMATVATPPQTGSAATGHPAGTLTVIQRRQVLGGLRRRLANKAAPFRVD